MTYKIGITVYDADNMLYETKVGLNDKKMTLLYSVWGKSEFDSKCLAESLIVMLNMGKVLVGEGEK